MQCEDILARPWTEAKQMLMDSKQDFVVSMTKHRHKFFLADESLLYVVRVIDISAKWQITLAAKMIKESKE